MPERLQTLFRGRRESRERLVGVVAGSGQVARCAAEAEADFVMVLSAGLYRNLGTGSLASFLAYGNANDQTEELLRNQILPAAGELPVVAGVLAHDPAKPLEERFSRLRALGVAGIANWPAVGFIDGQFRAALEAEGLGIESEVAMLKAAAGHQFAAFAFALDENSAHRFAAAGADVLVLNLGLTRQVSDIHERRDQLQRDLTRLRAMHASVRASGRSPLTLVFGGPVTTPDDFEQILRHSEVDGYAGGSVFERLPIHETVTATIRHFKSVARRAGHSSNIAAGLGEMIGRSAPMRQLFSLIQRVARRDVNIVVEGESGTGKELVATLLHRLSPRASHSFVTLNCGAIPEPLLESELFGHEKGAFTGAHRRRLGKFELAHHGTLFLDEIGDLSPHAQVALLRAIQQREITRVGGEVSLPVDVRIIAASHQHLPVLVRAGRFRADLFYRLNGMTLQVPPLRDRVEDIPQLAEAMLSRIEAQWGQPPKHLSSRFLNRLARHSWPGNVRELEHAIRQAALLEDGPVLEGSSFSPEPLTASPALPAFIPRAQPSVRRTAVEEALREANGNKSRAAQALGITRKTLYAWMRA